MPKNHRVGQLRWYPFTCASQERLAFHQFESGPLMERLRGWFDEQFEQKQVEPNSSLGEAIRYMVKHWQKLTVFLRVPGAPLDNNICERALKKAILHRKNAMFFKTRHGARIGDIFMTLIHTAEVCGVNAWDYLTQLQRHHEAVVANVGAWMPWNYTQTLAAHSAPATTDDPTASVSATDPQMV